MADFLLADGDLPLRNELITGRVDTQQRIALRLQRHLGEWFLDTTVGLPYEAWMEQKPPDLPSIVAAIRSEISAVRGVIGTQNFSGVHDRDTRTVRIEGEYLVSPGIAEEIALISNPTSSGNSAFFGVFFNPARPVGQPPPAPVGAYYNFGGVF